MKTTSKIINGNLYEFDSNGNEIHFKTFTGFESWSEYDINGKEIHYKDSNGYEIWREFDSNGKEIHYKDSDGFEYWYDSNGNKITKKQFDKLNSSCAGKVVEIDGKKYQLTLI